jgi:tetratricopeptide (TPR) repeat protein
VATLEDFGAIQLFVQCVRQLQPQFSLSAAGPSWVARICQLVEGMPLAIELAAPWVRAMRCQDIAQAIERDMGFLASSLRDMPVRHRSMRAVFDRSWEQLSDRERRVLERLSVFRGGFPWQAAEDVAEANLTMLSSLVDRSWLRPTPSGRYEIHELVRQYAFEHLEADQQVEQRVRDRHTQYFAGFLRERQRNLKGWGQAKALREVLAEMDNVQVAWHWAVERGQVEAIEGCLVALWLVGETRGRYHEIQQAFEGAAAKLRDELHADMGVGADPAQAQAVLLLAEILPMQAYFCKRIGATERAKVLCDESLSLLPSIDPGLRRDIACAEAKATLGFVLLQWGETSDAAPLFWEALALARAAGDAWIEARALLLLGWRVFQLGEYMESEAFLRQAIAASDREGEQWHKSWNLHTLAQVLTVRGEYGEGEEAALESLRLHREMRDRVGRIHSIMALGDIDMALGYCEQAEQRYQEGYATASEIGSKMLQSWSLSRQGWLALALGRHAEAREQFERAHALAREIRSRWRAIDDLTGLGHATCALGELHRSRQCLRQALGEAIEVGLRPEALSALVGLAGVSSREGDLDRATELLALVLHHPASSQATTRRAQRALSDLASELPQETLAAATERGRERELEELAAEILAGQ